MANKNANLHNAKSAKNDEFYTQLSDIEKELVYYKDHFKDKIVFCNCDDPEYSNFWKYFSLNFDHLHLKKLIATHYETDKQSYKLEMYRDNAGVHTDIKTLQQNGDFRSPESVELLKECDIVVTNPPFSLFREYIAQLIEYDKKFLVIGNLNAVKYKEVFPLLKENKIWMGATSFTGGAAYFIGDQSLYDPDKMSNPKHAYIKDGKLYWRVNGVRWFTNLDHKKRHEEIILCKSYNSQDYPSYDDYNAINVDNCKNIPMDYDGCMGVPISFMDKYCPEQFEIVGELNNGGDNEYDYAKPKINKKQVYTRFLIKRKDS